MRTWYRRMVVGVAIAAALLATARPGHAQAEPFRDPALPLATRVADLLGRLTLDEKISLLHQYSPAIPRLGVARLPHRHRGAARRRPGSARPTVFPQAVGLASTWDPALVQQVGTAVGREARGFHARNPAANGLNLWAPVVNPLRDPRWGRNEEGYSEDPLLTGADGHRVRPGPGGDHPDYLQTAPTLKHYLAYNNETDRATTSAMRPAADPRRRTRRRRSGPPSRPAPRPA